MAVGVGQVADLVDDQQGGGCVQVQARAQGRVAVQGCEFTQELTGGGEAHGVAVQHGLMGDVLGDGGLSEPGGADQDGVAGLAQEGQLHEFGDGALVALLGPAPVEVGQGFEAPDVGAAQAPLQGAAGALGLLPVQQGRQPGLPGAVVPVRQQPVQLQGGSTLAQGVRMGHRRAR